MQGILKGLRSEAGVITTEAVAVTAMFLVVAMVIAWFSITAALGESITIVGEGLLDFIETGFP